MSRKHSDDMTEGGLASLETTRSSRQIPAKRKSRIMSRSNDFYGSVDDMETRMDQMSASYVSSTCDETTGLLDHYSNVSKSSVHDIDFEELSEKNPLVSKLKLFHGNSASFSDICSSERANLSWRTILHHAKVAFLFICLVTCMAIFMASSELNSYDRQISVTSSQPHKLNVTGVNENTPVLRLTLVGSFLLTQPNKDSLNVTVTVSNPVSNFTWNITQALADFDTRESLPEIPVMSLVDMQDQQYTDHIIVTIETTDETPVPLLLSCVCLTPEVYHGVIYATVILVIVYVLIIFELVHRTIAAILGSFASLAVLAYLNQKPSLSEVLSWLDEETLCLLFGMMLLVAIFCETGFFDWAALYAYKLVGGKKWPLVTILCVFSAIISAFLDNVTTVLLLTPVTIRLCEAMELEPRHVLIAEVIFSNIGGTGTAVGDPPNLLIVSNSHLIKATSGRLNFSTFTLHTSVGVIFTVLVAYAFIRLVYVKADLLKCEDSSQVAELKVEREIWRRTTQSMAVATREESMVRVLLKQKMSELDILIQQKAKEEKDSCAKDVGKVIAEMEERYYIQDKVLLIKSSVVLLAVIVMFFVSPLVPAINVSTGWIAVIGACCLLVLSDHSDLEAVLHRIEWATLIFFSGLFVLMEALQRLGLIDWIAEQAISIIQGISEDARLAVAIIIVLWISAFASAFIDNIPFTTAMIPVIVKLAQNKEINISMDPLIWALAFGACLGGNGTLLGASANVVCAGIAETHGHGFNFWQFFKIGFPAMLCTVTTAMVYLLVCHVAFTWSL